MNLLPTSLALFDLGMGELILIAFIFLMLFGAKRLPELFRSLGQSIKEFKKAASDVEDNLRVSIQDEERKRTASNGAPAATVQPTPAAHPPDQKV
jgi:sec-independent protein translocase protein TatA